ncbi:MAG TPA: twin-arginine translocase TatA/TatE family subunit [Lentisphaeria bacterium]|nr:twin-arginine translocase TatA/TatE family subunit [Lentisphaeria bacterium]
MSIGLTELLLIVCFVVLVFGSKRIPELARALGRASREFKKARDAVERESAELLDDGAPTDVQASVDSGSAAPAVRQPAGKVASSPEKEGVAPK